MIENFVDYINNNEKYKQLCEKENAKKSEIVEYEDFAKICKKMPKSIIKDFFEYNYIDVAEFNRYYSLSDILEQLCDLSDCGDIFEMLEDFDLDYESIKDIKDDLEASIDKYLDWALKQKHCICWPAD